MSSLGNARYSSYRCFGVPIFIPILLFVTIAAILRLTMSDQTSVPSKQGSSMSSQSNAVNVHFRFTAPDTYFLPALSSTNPTTFNPQTTNFGLIHQSYSSDSSLPTSPSNPTDWQRFTHHIATLNANSPASTTHHILFLSRHGQGYHNLAESYYGRDPWNCYFSALDGDPQSNITWADAPLSKLGRRQAGEQNRFWRSQYEEAKMPRPKSWWVSPMERACRTAEITHGFGADEMQGRTVTVKEYLREMNGIHTCDRRSPRSVIAKNYPGYTIEEGFSEQDVLWDPIYRETAEAHTFRAKLALDDIFGNLESKSDGEYLSITSHSGMTNALLRAMGHRYFPLQVGSAMAVYVQAEKIDGKRPEEKFDLGRTTPKCEGDPLKAGLPGYKNFKEYVDSVEGDVEEEV